MRDHATASDLFLDLADLDDADLGAVLDRLDDDQCAALLGAYHREQAAVIAAEAVVLAATFTAQEEP